MNRFGSFRKEDAKLLVSSVTIVKKKRERNHRERFLSYLNCILLPRTKKMTVLGPSEPASQQDNLRRLMCALYPLYINLNNPL